MNRTSEPSPDPERASRLVSLDVFRGLTLAGMILVNNPGSWAHVYPPLRHAEWHGWTPTDLVFPSFVFIVGVSIPLALGKRLERGDSSTSLLWKVLRRSLIIVAIGLFLNAFPFDRPLHSLRYPGVLQRIGICYCAASLIYLYTSVRSQVWITAGLLLGYWLAMSLLPVPGIGPGDLSRPNNLAAWIDRGLMGGHLYKSDYDPEGLFSTLPAIATALIGVLTGRYISVRRGSGDWFGALCASGAIAMFAGLCWGAVFPINKALWTSSFTLLMAGLSLQLLGICAWLIEVQGFRRWSAPFVVLGANPILAYVLSSMLARLLSTTTLRMPGTGQLVPVKDAITNQFAVWTSNPSLASLCFGLTYVLFWIAIMSVFYRMRWFLRV
ncbi:MAG: lpg1661 family Dot/Icm T4SS effector [Isosphaeraceae bacterium]